MNCDASLDLLQRFLDGESKPDSLDFADHLATCFDCASRWRAAERFKKMMWKAPLQADFNAERTVKAVRRDRQLRRAASWAGTAAAIAASVALGVWLIGGARRIDDQSIAKSGDAGGLRLDLAQSRAAVAGFTRRSYDSVLPIPNLALPSDWAGAVVPKDALQPAARSLNDARQGLSAGMEPMTNSAHRAYEMFVPRSLRREHTPAVSDGNG